MTSEEERGKVGSTSAHRRAVISDEFADLEYESSLPHACLLVQHPTVAFFKRLDPTMQQACESPSLHACLLAAQQVGLKRETQACTKL